MAHMQKHTKSRIGSLLRHNRRENENYSNENIDKSETYRNYSFGEQRSEQYAIDYAEKYLKITTRSDTKYLISWIVSKPQDLKLGDEKRFFSICDRFIRDRYGHDNENNFIDSSVHMDESNPHLNEVFVPIGYDKKADKYRCRASLVCNRNDLRTFHRDLSKYVEKELGYHVEILNGRTKNQSIAEMKAERKYQEEHEKKLASLKEKRTEKIEVKPVAIPVSDYSNEKVNALNYKTAVAERDDFVEQLQESLYKSRRKNQSLIKDLNEKNKIIDERNKIIDSLHREQIPIEYIKDYDKSKKKNNDKKIRIAEKNLSEVEKKIEETEIKRKSLENADPILKNLASVPSDWMQWGKEKIVDLTRRVLKYANNLKKDYEKLVKYCHNLQSRNKGLESKIEKLESEKKTDSKKIDRLQDENFDLIANLNREKESNRKLNCRNQKLTESLVVRSESSKEQLQKSDDFISDLLERSFGLPEDSRNIVLKSLRENPDSKTAWRTLNWQIAKEEEKTHFRGRSL